MRGRVPRTAVVSSLALLLCGLSACVTETRPSAPERERASIARPSRPSGVDPQQMLLTAGVASDADGNGFPDTIPVTVYLFGDTRRYALPLAEQGSFEFEATTQDGVAIGRWIFPPEETAAAKGESPAGVCYRFALRLSPERDRFRTTAVGLRAIFTQSKTGQKVVSPGVASVRLGAGE